MGIFITIADCPKCESIGVRMYFDGTSMWCSRCHSEVDSKWTRR